MQAETARTSAAAAPQPARPGLRLAAPHRDPRLLVALATYNERDNLRPLVAEILNTLPYAHVLIVDDNSPDGTGDLADGLAADDPRVRVMHRAGKLGLGTAVLAAMRHSLEHDYELLLTMDADFSHAPRYLPALVGGSARCDVMIGSRYVRGGGTRNWPLSRRLISRGVNLLVRLLFRMPARDASGAFRCYRVDALRRARLDRLLSHGYSFQQEVLHCCHEAGAALGETPIVFVDRAAGASKVDWREAVRSLSMLVWLGLKSTFRP